MNTNKGGATKTKGGLDSHGSGRFGFLRLASVVGALIAAVAPAIMATADGPELRGSVSAYWNMDQHYLFCGPFLASAFLLCADGLDGYRSSSWRDFGSRRYNVVLGASLASLTRLNVTDYQVLHTVSAVVFFVLFILIVCYTSFLGWFGEHDPVDEPHSGEAEKAGAKLSAVFMGLLAATLIAFSLGWVTFFFFEVFALVNFALFYVQGLIVPFPYSHYGLRK